MQMYHLEQIGYFDYHKLEYAKICQDDIIIASYQQTVNTLTDAIGNNTEQNNTHVVQTRASVIASTDVIEYLRRKKIPLVLLRFGELANQGVETFHELLNEKLFPRSDRLREGAVNVLNFFPVGWQECISNENLIDTNLTLRDTFYAEKWNLKRCNKISVKILRELLIECQPVLPMPYYNVEKFELLNLNVLQHNPFTLSRKSLKAPRDRFFKYRLLHGDVFCKSRMFRFKMVEDPYCGYCGNVETIKHLIWDCPRSSRVWKYINNLTRAKLGRDYVSYNTVILGNENTIPGMEVIITWSLRLIMAIERNQELRDEVVLNQIKTLFFYEKTCYRINSKQMRSRWGELIELFRETMQN
jgi:hypothetical protein